MTRLIRRSWALAAFVGLASSVLASPPSNADPLDIEIFGHRLKYNPDYTNKDYEKEMTFGERLKVVGSLIQLEKIDRIRETYFILGTAGPGGNMCDSAPFIFAVSPGEDPKLFGPIDVCNATTIAYDQSGITITENGVVGDKVRTWRWTPDGGLNRTEAVKAASFSKGWNTIWERKIDHPADLLESQEIAGALDGLMGADAPEYRKQMGGLGSARYIGDFFAGSACIKFECDETGQFTGLDLQTKTAFAAFKPRGKRIVVRPEVKQWPAQLRRELADWAKRWR